MQEHTAPKDELTIHEFNEQVSDLVHFLQSVFYQYRKGLWRYRAVMALLLAAITGGVVYYSFHLQRTFEGKASYAYTSLQRKLYGEAIDNVNTLLQAHDYRQLQAVLHLDASQVKHILEIKATNNFGSRLSDDLTENNNHIFYITVKSTEHAVFDSLDIALERYLNNNIAVKELQQLRAEKFKSAITYREKELVELDSLTRAYTRGLGAPAQPVFPSEQGQLNAAALFEKGERITEEIADMQSFLQDPRAVKLQQPFLVSELPLRNPALKVAGIIVLVFGVVSGLLIFILSNVIRPAHVPQ
ncbi:MAG TPA: hypothetical protein VGC22_14460 [Chitinophaga sp.]